MPADRVRGQASCDGHVSGSGGEAGAQAAGSISTAWRLLCGVALITPSAGRCWISLQAAITTDLDPLHVSIGGVALAGVCTEGKEHMLDVTWEHVDRIAFSAAKHAAVLTFTPSFVLPQPLGPTTLTSPDSDKFATALTTIDVLFADAAAFETARAAIIAMRTPSVTLVDATPRSGRKTASGAVIESPITGDAHPEAVAVRAERAASATNVSVGHAGAATVDTRADVSRVASGGDGTRIEGEDPSPVDVTTAGAAAVTASQVYDEEEAAAAAPADAAHAEDSAAGAAAASDPTQAAMRQRLLADAYQLNTQAISMSQQLRSSQSRAPKSSTSPDLIVEAVADGDGAGAMLPGLDDVVAANRQAATKASGRGHSAHSSSAAIAPTGSDNAHVPPTASDHVADTAAAATAVPTAGRSAGKRSRDAAAATASEVDGDDGMQRQAEAEPAPEAPLPRSYGKGKTATGRASSKASRAADAPDAAAAPAPVTAGQRGKLAAVKDAASASTAQPLTATRPTRKAAQQAAAKLAEQAHAAATEEGSGDAVAAGSGDDARAAESTALAAARSSPSLFQTPLPRNVAPTSGSGSALNVSMRKTSTLLGGAPRPCRLAAVAAATATDAGDAGFDFHADAEQRHEPASAAALQRSGAPAAPAARAAPAPLKKATPAATAPTAASSFPPSRLALAAAAGGAVAVSGGGDDFDFAADADGAEDDSVRVTSAVAVASARREPATTSRPALAPAFATSRKPASAVTKAAEHRVPTVSGHKRPRSSDAPAASTAAATGAEPVEAELSATGAPAELASGLLQHAASATARRSAASGRADADAAESVSSDAPAGGAALSSFGAVPLTVAKPLFFGGDSSAPASSGRLGLRTTSVLHLPSSQEARGSSNSLLQSNKRPTLFGHDDDDDAILGTAADDVPATAIKRRRIAGDTGPRYVAGGDDAPAAALGGTPAGRLFDALRRVAACARLFDVRSDVHRMATELMARANKQMTALEERLKAAVAAESHKRLAALEVTLDSRAKDATSSVTARSNAVLAKAKAARDTLVRSVEAARSELDDAFASLSSALTAAVQQLQAADARHRAVLEKALAAKQARYDAAITAVARYADDFKRKSSALTSKSSAALATVAPAGRSDGAAAGKAAAGAAMDLQAQLREMEARFA